MVEYWNCLSSPSQGLAHLLGIYVVAYLAGLPSCWLIVRMDRELTWPTRGLSFVVIPVCGGFGVMVLGIMACLAEAFYCLFCPECGGLF